MSIIFTSILNSVVKSTVAVAVPIGTVIWLTATDLTPHSRRQVSRIQLPLNPYFTCQANFFVKLLVPGIQTVQTAWRHRLHRLAGKNRDAQCAIFRLGED